MRHLLSLMQANGESHRVSHTCGQLKQLLGTNAWGSLERKNYRMYMSKIDHNKGIFISLYTDEKKLLYSLSSAYKIEFLKIHSNFVF